MTIKSKFETLGYPSLTGILVLLTMATLTACSKSAPEERLIEAGEKVADASAEIQALSRQIKQHEEALERLRDDRLREKAKLQTLEERLAARATDVALFRAVQAALLNDKTLRQTAINANVENGEVVLRGVVASEAERQRAIEISRDTAGVDAVTSRIRVANAQSNAS